MQRNENESFEAYQVRRANSNAAAKRINQSSKKSGKQTSREIHREQRNNKKHAGSYGRGIMAAFAQRLSTQERLDKHMEYLEAAKARKIRRAA